MFPIATATPYLFAIAAVTEREQEENNNDGDNADEDFEEQNTIQICCTWGKIM
jgi:hypothetical protein